jgi:two-component system, chemotaxis family, protein-glutamate methylesterase/glutaminase
VTTHDIIVIGGSAGSHAGLKSLVRNLPPALPASVFVVIHLQPRAASVLPHLLNNLDTLPAKHPEHGERIRKGEIYVAPPDRHMVLAENHIHLSHGPKEGLHRPSINVTFRSAAKIYRDRVVGVLLSGMLDDGASGLWDIATWNGITVIQDPAEAPFPSMPLSALQDVPIDYTLDTENIAPLLTKLVNGSDLSRIQRSSTTSSPDLDKFTGFTCPECHGPLYEYRDRPVEFRCRVGHVFPLETLLSEQTSTQERKLYEALVSIEEGADLTNYVAVRRNGATRERLLAESGELRKHAALLREMLEKRRASSPTQEPIEQPKAGELVD